MKTHPSKKSTLKSTMTFLKLKRTPRHNKSKRNTKSWPNNSTLIEKMEMSKNSSNSMKPMKLSVTQKKEKYMTSTDLREGPQVKRISSTCSSEEEDEEEPEVVLEDERKCLKLNLPKRHSISPLKTFTTAESSNSNTLEPDAAKSVMVRVDKMSKNVNNAREKVWSFKCIKWVQECINKFKSTVINAVERERLFLKEESAKDVMLKRFSRRQR
jgi:hypothetical protein